MSNYDGEVDQIAEGLWATSARGVEDVCVALDATSVPNALRKFRRCSVRTRANYYLDSQLATILQLEDRHESVAYLWLRSHIEKKGGGKGGQFILRGIPKRISGRALQRAFGAPM